MSSSLNSFAITHLNVRSLPKHFNEIVQSNNIMNNDVICFSETWLNSSHFSSQYSIPYYNFIRKDRKSKSRGGGLCIYLKNSLKYEVLSVPESDVVESLVVRISLKDGLLDLVLVYCPPGGVGLVTPLFEKIFEDTAIGLKDAVIMGDFNINWLRPSLLKTAFESLMSLHSFTQYITEPTRKIDNNSSGSIIDLVFSNSSQITNCFVTISDISDHYQISSILSSKKVAPIKENTILYKRDFSKFDPDEFFDHAKYVAFHKTEDFACPHEAAEYLENSTSNLINQFAPFKHKSLKPAVITWKNSFTMSLIKIKNRLFKAFKASGEDKNSTRWAVYKEARNKAANAIKTSKAKSIKAIIDNPDLDIWTKIRLVRGKNIHSCGKVEEIIHNNTSFKTDEGIANSLNNYFSTIGFNLNQELLKNITPGTDSATFIEHSDGFVFNTVSTEDVAKILNKLKNKKNGGVNQIPAFIYKLLAPLILSPLTYLINNAISKNIYPNIWKKALVIPIHKGNDPSLPNNYRPISLLPILSKVFEKILNNQIRKNLDIHRLINTRQFGFRPGCSTDQLIFQLYFKLKSVLGEKESKYVTLAALDIKKAFDCVNHSMLAQKLNKIFKFSTSATNLIVNYLQNRSQILKCNNTLSKLSPISTGVPQGSVLGPLLFIMYVNDIMSLNNCYLFADDCLVLSTGSDLNIAAKNLETDLKHYSKWYKDNLLVVNASKTNIITLSNKKFDHKKAPKILFQNTQITQKNTLKYLGFHLDNQLKFHKHLASTKKKVYPILQSFMRSRKYISENIALRWYVGLIRPVIEYCAPILYSGNKNIVEGLMSVENRCLKIISSNSKSVTRYKFHLPSLKSRIKYLFLLAFFKFTHSLVPIINTDILPKEPMSGVTRFASSGGFLLGRGTGAEALNFAISNYNSLPQKIRAITRLKQFKSALKTELLVLDIDDNVIDYLRNLCK